MSSLGHSDNGQLAQTFLTDIQDESAFPPMQVRSGLNRRGGTESSGVLYSAMTDQEQPDKTGNEPAPLLLAAIAVVPLLAVVGWLVFA
jgi:hypothetical protein